MFASVTVARSVEGFLKSEWEGAMGDPSNIATALELEQLAGDLHSLAFEEREESRSLVRADRIIAEGERIAAAVRSLFRG